MMRTPTIPNPFIEKTTNLFCNIIDHYKNANEDTKFFVLFNRRDFNTKLKFKVISDLLSNLFVSPKIKTVLLDLFCKSQRTYYVLSKFAHKYQFRKAKVCVDTDLCLNPIEKGHRKTVTLFDKHTRSVFLFTCTDLVSIIMTALTHSRNFFIEPLVCKNPYTNMPFTKSSLYAIYFHIQENYPVIPPLLHSFFISHFDVDVFTIQNEQTIRNLAVKNYMKNSSMPSLYLEVLHMLHLVSSKLKIHSKFPNELLVDIMRPYLYLYVMFMYSIQGSEQRSIYYLILKKKMGEFCVFNPQFGRKRIDFNRVIKFNCDYPDFTLDHINEIIKTKQYMNWYSYWDCWNIPNPYSSQLSRLNGYSPSLYRTDVDGDDDDDEDDQNDDEDNGVNGNADTNTTITATTITNVNECSEDEDEDEEEDENNEYQNSDDDEDA